MRNTPLSYAHTPVLVKLTHPNAKLPRQADGDVGFDLACVDDFTMEPHQTSVVPTGLQLASSMEPLVVDNKIVATSFLKVEGRSGLASKGIFPVGGVIDPSYRGEIKVVLHNSADQVQVFKAGDRVAQLVIYYVQANQGAHSRVSFLSTENVESSERGDKGFGSTGN